MVNRKFNKFNLLWLLYYICYCVAHYMAVLKLSQRNFEYRLFMRRHIYKTSYMQHLLKVNGITVNEYLCKKKITPFGSLSKIFCKR